MAHKLDGKVALITGASFGIPFLSPYPVDRYIALCQAFERLRVDIINLQEVHTYNLFHLLKKNLPSYPYVAYESALPGPQGGLVTLSRHSLEKFQFTRLLAAFSK